MKGAYDGPELTATLEVMESQPPQFAVAVNVQAPSGGYELKHAETKSAGAATEVLLVLTGPGPDEMVMQMLETKSLRVPLAQVAGEVRVGVRQVRRGVAAPEAQYALAATLRKP